MSSGINARDIVMIELDNFADAIWAAAEEFDVEDYSILNALKEISLVDEMLVRL